MGLHVWVIMSGAHVQGNLFVLEFLHLQLVFPVMKPFLFGLYQVDGAIGQDSHRYPIPMSIQSALGISADVNMSLKILGNILVFVTTCP